ncbi:MAG: CopG family transcriptional regulator [Chloroflexi bacterium]|nr:CopG family transcriptional regulator [Chloroflexota bacterium]
MRTTVTLDDDVVAAVEQVRQQQRIGLSEAVNQLVRAGIQRPERRPYRHRSSNVTLKVDVSNIGAVLDLLDQQ